MADDMSMYDEPMTDQDPRSASENPRSPGEDTTDTEDGGAYESFLAPKSAFKGDISPGTVHKVRIERALDTELELKCIEGGDEAETTDNPQEETSESMY